MNDYEHTEWHRKNPNPDGGTYLLMVLGLLLLLFVIAGAFECDARLDHLEREALGQECSVKRLTDVQCEPIETAP